MHIILYYTHILQPQNFLRFYRRSPTLLPDCVATCLYIKHDQLKLPPQRRQPLQIALEPTTKYTGSRTNTKPFIITSFIGVLCQNERLTVA